MLDFEHSTQLNSWLYTQTLLAECRDKANREAREFLANTKTDGSNIVEGSLDGVTSAATTGFEGEHPDAKREMAVRKRDMPLPVKHFARGYYSDYLSRQKKNVGDNGNNPNASSGDSSSSGSSSWTSSLERGCQLLLNPEEELLLVRFYAGKLPNLIGPRAFVPRCRRDAKVVATAALLLRRFYLSNSVMSYDPKTIMVAAAFLASKVEDATEDVRGLEEGTNEMQAAVPVEDILKAELVLVEGLEFDLMCFHPYKTVLAYTEDLRTFLKSERGRAVVVVVGDIDVGKPPPVISGEDLRPIHDRAQRIVEDVCASDIPLLYTPGQIGLAAMIVASEDVSRDASGGAAVTTAAADDGDGKNSITNSNELQNSVFSVAKIDMYGYIRTRFEGRSEEEYQLVEKQMKDLSMMLRELKEGKHGCGNHGIDVQTLKPVHKKLKKCRAWGMPKGAAGAGAGAGTGTGAAEENGGKKKKKKKKRKAENIEK